MADLFTSLTFFALMLLTVAAWGMALYRLRYPTETQVAGATQQVLIGIVGVGSAAIFVVRWAWAPGHWQPVAAHVDGLALIAALLAGTIGYLQTRRRMLGLSAFAMPVLAVILGWGICAAAWTYRPFNLQTLDPVWRGVHLMGVYLGTACAAIAAVAGGTYLYVQYQLKHKQALSSFGRLAPLETLETLIVRTATLGFALLTLGLLAGLIVWTDSGEAPVAGWWFAPKIILAVGAWLAYALVMNVRYTSRFRGARAAWLAIGGLVLLLVVYGLVTAWPHQPNTTRAAIGETALTFIHDTSAQATRVLLPLPLGEGRREGGQCQSMTPDLTGHRARIAAPLTRTHSRRKRRCDSALAASESARHAPQSTLKNRPLPIPGTFV